MVGPSLTCPATAVLLYLLLYLSHERPGGIIVCMLEDLVQDCRHWWHVAAVPGADACLRLPLAQHSL